MSLNQCPKKVIDISLKFVYSNTLFVKKIHCLSISNRNVVAELKICNSIFLPQFSDQCICKALFASLFFPHMQFLQSTKFFTVFLRKDVEQT